MAMVENVIVYGAQVPVALAGEPMNVQMAPAAIAGLLTQAGLPAESITEIRNAMLAEGFGLPSAWAKVRNEDLHEMGVGRGYVAGVVGQFQTRVTERCGVAFVRLMRGAAQRSDADVAREIQKGKNIPAAPQVSESSGWAPSVDSWRDYVAQWANWLGPIDAQLAASVQAIADDHAVAQDELQVARSSEKSRALGSALRGSGGLGQIIKLLPTAPLVAGCGLWMLQDVSGTVLGANEEMQFLEWQHPTPVVQAHLIEAGVVQWQNRRAALLKAGSVAAGCDMIAKASYLELAL